MRVQGRPSAAQFVLMQADDPTPHLEQFQSYDQACREFRCSIPQNFNLARAVCQRHPDAVTRVALNEVKRGGINTYTFGGLDFLSDKFAMALSESGIGSGDAVAVALPQSAALAIAQLGVLKAGAVVVPLSTTWQMETLYHALADSGAAFLVIDESFSNYVEHIALSLQSRPRTLVVRDLRPPDSASRHNDFWSVVDRASSDFDVAETEASSPAFIFYKGQPNKQPGVVHSHSSLIGQLTAFEMCGNLESGADRVFWRFDHWCTMTALLGMLYPAWWYGCAVLASANDELGLPRLIEGGQITHAFVPSSRLEDLRRMFARERIEGRLQTIVTDTAVSDETRDSVATALGAAVNGIYGESETGVIAATCVRWFPTAPGSHGRSVPGHTVTIIDESGGPLPPFETGRVAVCKLDPALFLGYHKDAANTAGAFTGDWFVTADSGYKNENGDLFITTSSSKKD